MEEEEKRETLINKLDNLDDRINAKGVVHKNIWQFIKFSIVSGIITVIQLGLLYLMYYLMKGWTEPLPSFLQKIFTESTVGKDHDNWGYVLPFFLSNFIANTIGYILNKKRTFKSDAPVWHYIFYALVLFALILFSTWFQGVLVNVAINWGIEAWGPFLAMNIAGFVQFLVLYPLQKFILLREKKVEEKDNSI